MNVGFLVGIFVLALVFISHGAKAETITLTKDANPNTLPTGTGFGLTVSPNGDFAVLGTLDAAGASAKMYVLRSGVWTQFFTASIGTARNATWCEHATPGGTIYHVAFATETSPFLKVYSITGFGGGLPQATLWSLTGGNPGTVTNSAKFSYDCNILFVTTETSPYLLVYDRNSLTSAYVKRTNTWTIPPATPKPVTLSCKNCTNGERLAIGSTGSPFFSWYRTDSMTVLTNPSVMPASAVRALAWHPNGTYLAVGEGTGIRIYKYTQPGGTPTLTSQGLVVTGLPKFANSISWSADGTILVATYSASARYSFFRWNAVTNTMTALTLSISAHIAGFAEGSSWSNKSNKLGFAHEVSPFVSFYETSLGSNEEPPTEGEFTVECSGLTCTYTVIGDTGGFAYVNWTFGDGGIATGNSVTHTYTDGNDYNVSLTLTPLIVTDENPILVTYGTAEARDFAGTHGTLFGGNLTAASEGFGISADSYRLLMALIIIAVLIGGGAGLAGTTGAVGGALIGVLISAGLDLIPLWGLMFMLMGGLAFLAYRRKTEEG